MKSRDDRKMKRLWLRCSLEVAWVAVNAQTSRDTSERRLKAHSAQCVSGPRLSTPRPAETGVALELTVGRRRAGKLEVGPPARAEGL